MTHRKIFFVAVLTLFVVFITSLAWEFVVEENVEFALGAAPETARTHFEFVITSTVFAALSVVVFALITGKIVSERQRVEDALSDQFRLQQILIDAIPLPIFYMDTNGLYLGCNAAFEDYAGLPKEKIIGKGGCGVPQKELAGIFHAADMELLKAGGRRIYEASVKYRDGGIHDVVFHKAMFCKSDGSFGGLVGVMIDITERKSIESSLRQSEMKFRNFASDAAHELRTPLSVLKLHLNELNDQENAQLLLKDVNNMSRTLEQLLALSRLDSKEAMKMENVDIGKVCKEVAIRLAPLAVREERSIEIIGAEKPVMINGNATALDHAVRNLLENALKYSARKTTITINVSDPPAISIINKGQGIAAEKRERIFKRFQRSDRRSDGAGLGLSIVQRVVEAHHGAIKVLDIPGGDGVNFTITF